MLGFAISRKVKPGIRFHQFHGSVSCGMTGTFRQKAGPRELQCSMGPGRQRGWRDHHRKYTRQQLQKDLNEEYGNMEERKKPIQARPHSSNSQDNPEGNLFTDPAGSGERASERVQDKPNSQRPVAATLDPTVDQALKPTLEGLDDSGMDDGAVNDLVSEGRKATQETADDSEKVRLKGKGMQVTRRYTTPGKHPFAEFELGDSARPRSRTTRARSCSSQDELRDPRRLVAAGDERGRLEVLPRRRGRPRTRAQRSSQLIGRVADTITGLGPSRTATSPRSDDASSSLPQPS
jgi:hypothetical protein